MSTSRLRTTTGWRVAIALLVAWPALAFEERDAVRVIAVASSKLSEAVARHPKDAYPKYTRGGAWVTVPGDAMLDWTQGFFPGCLWLMFEATDDASWQSQAQAWTSGVEVQQTNRQTHDLGFKFMTSFGQQYRLTDDTHAREVLLTAAGSLASRYDRTVGVISTGDWNPDWRVPNVIDTMMNLELLLWGAEHGGDAEWRQMALSHALKTKQDLIREDGGTFQVVDYDAQGNIRKRGTYQGYSDASTWARGHAWAIYGFTMVYRYTRDERMLEAAREVTEYYLEHVDENFVPKWDFQAPDALEDSSTAAIVASALLELSGFVDAQTGARYRDAALRTLDTLASPEYLGGTDFPALLRHGTGDYPAKQGVDEGLIYGDYYLLEAVNRFRSMPPPAPPPTEDGTPPLDGFPPPPGSPEGEDAGKPPSGQLEPGGCSTGGGGTMAALLLVGGLLLRRRAFRHPG